ncbi:NADH-quinone oxidoreductase subunit N [Alloacidobacterium sp.]|uniref:NADH-quinone oxidoreductase subunit N n=1 Tax=Alloacidobacterium sp. TaxID=2951999 RepID=UPI002D393F13|nr:NADH-quinone oxidoreductase subunit N [Alloacidobacterium sp.]HYK36122.1 NADH-quinone oxidoreductase subunit N [Alloacidobacterium sp.]
MNAAEFTAASPLLIMSATAIVAMLAIAVRRNHFVIAAITLVGVVASFCSLFFAESAIPRQITSLLIFDSYSLVYMALLLCAASFVILFSYGYLKQRREHREEFYLLILLATTGSMVLVVSRHFISFFLGLELLSVSLYVLISYIRYEAISIEAGIKYLVLAASSSSALLFGLALIYAESGSMELSQFAAAFGHSATFPPIAGLMLVLTGVGFKLAVVPFHLWTPDVYEGAPLPVTAFIATVSKGGMFALILRWFHVTGTGISGTAGLILAIIAIASMLAGNLLALTQTNVKRILAYSSIAHMGYALVALLAGGMLGAPAATYYLAAYFTTILGAFGVMTILSDPQREAAYIDDYRGLFWRRPVLAGIFTAMLLSLAGIPLTAGFLGKFYVMTAGASQARWLLLFTLVVSSTIGLFYYLRIVAAMYAKTTDMEPARSVMPLPATVALAVLTGLVFLLGIYPAPLWTAIVTAARSLG